MNATDIVCGSVNGNAKITLKDPNNKNVKVIKDPNKTAILC
jgi:hypothetical protein